MPCDQILVNQVEFTTAIGHEGLLAEALRSMGYTVSESGKTLSFYKDGRSGTYSRGQFTTQQGQELDTDAVKRAFSTTVVKAAAKKYGWSFSEKAGKIQIKKRA